MPALIHGDIVRADELSRAPPVGAGVETRIASSGVAAVAVKVVPGGTYMATARPVNTLVTTRPIVHAAGLERAAAFLQHDDRLFIGEQVRGGFAGASRRRQLEISRVPFGAPRRWSRVQSRCCGAGGSGCRSASEIPQVDKPVEGKKLTVVARHCASLIAERSRFMLRVHAGELIGLSTYV